MFRDKGEKQATRLLKDAQQYRNSSAVFEIEPRMKQIEMDLMFERRHLMTSNDRYQFSAAYMLLARNKITLGTHILDANSQPNALDGMQDVVPYVDALTNFVKTSYAEGHDFLEIADRITEVKGFEATAIDVQNVKSAQEVTFSRDLAVTWPNVSGAVDAFDIMTGTFLYDLRLAVESEFLPNNFKHRLKANMKSDIAELDVIRKAIARNSGGIISAKTTSHVLHDVFGDAMKGIGILNRLTVQLAIPRLYDPYFELVHPLDELRGPVKAFNPNTLGTTALTGAAPKPEVQARPVIPPKPFTPDILAPPVSPAPDVKPQTAPTTPVKKKEFDPTVLDVRATHSHPFDPSVLKPND